MRAPLFSLLFGLFVNGQLGTLVFIPGNGSSTLRSRLALFTTHPWVSVMDPMLQVIVAPFVSMQLVGTPAYAGYPPTSLGKYSGWYASNLSATGLTYAAMFFDGGAPCGQYRPTRQGLAYITCGPVFSIGVFENPTCFFTANVQLPEACGVDLRVGFESVSASPTPSASPTRSASPTASRSASRSTTPSRTGSRTRTSTRSPTFTTSGSPSGTNSSASRSTSPSGTRTATGSRTASPTTSSTCTVTAGGLAPAPLRLVVTFTAEGAGASAAVAAALVSGPLGPALRRDVSRLVTPLVVVRSDPLPVSAVQVIITAINGVEVAAGSPANFRRRAAGEEAVSVALSASLSALALDAVRGDVALLLANASRLSAALDATLAVAQTACGCRVIAAAATAGVGVPGGAAAGSALGAALTAAGAAVGALCFVACAVVFFRVRCGRRRSTLLLSEEALGKRGGSAPPPPRGSLALLEVRSPELREWAAGRGQPLAVGPGTDEGLELFWAPAWTPRLLSFSAPPLLSPQRLQRGFGADDPLPVGASV